VEGNHCHLKNASLLELGNLCFPSVPKCHSYALVVEDSELVGLFTERDIVRLTAENKDLTQFTIAEVMTRDVVTLQASQQSTEDIHIAISLMHQHRIRHLPIVGDRGQLQGLITANSLSHALQPSNLLRLRQVKEAMTSEVVCAPLSASVLRVSQLMSFGSG